jgi:hypothetical protein
VGPSWRSPEAWLGRVYLVPRPIFSFSLCLLSAMLWAMLSHHMLPAMTMHGPDTTEPSDHGLKPLKPWAKINPFSLKLLILSQWQKADCYHLEENNWKKTKMAFLDCQRSGRPCDNKLQLERGNQTAPICRGWWQGFLKMKSLNNTDEKF